MDDELLQVDATGPADEREAIDFFDNLEQTIDVMSDDAAAFESEEAEATDEEEE